MSIASMILDMLFPKKCIACGKEGKYVCKSCELYMLDVPQTEGLTALWEYNGIVKELIQRIRNNGEYDIIKELVNKKDFDISEDTLITYVPMHIKKKRKIGFNPAEIIAKEIGKKNKKPVVKMLEKTKDQAVIQEECFVLNEGYNNYSKAVLLVNDIYNTGTTMEDCKKVLKRGGIDKVWGFVMARTA